MGIDDYIIVSLGLIALYLIRFWLVKIYYRIKQIAKICEYFFKEYKKRNRNE